VVGEEETYFQLHDKTQAGDNHGEKMIEDVQSEIQCLFADTLDRGGVKKLRNELPQFQSRLEEIKKMPDGTITSLKVIGMNLFKHECNCVESMGLGRLGLDIEYDEA